MMFKNMVRKATGCIIGFLACSSSFSQLPVNPLTIGDKVPDIRFEHVLNYSSKKANLSDFRGKLVILDFWGTWCTTCITSFPRMDSLQKRFGDQIQILLVNPYKAYDTEDRIQKTLNRLKLRTGYFPSCPIPIHDTVIEAYFPHKSVPHEVWIDAKGEVIAITGHKEVNAANIQLALEGKPQLVVKNDFGFDQQLPLLVDGNGGESGEFLFRSMFTGYNQVGHGVGPRINEEGMVTGYYLLNHTLLNLIKSAYPRLLSVAANRIIYEGVDREKLNVRYCYDLTIKPISWSQFDYSLYLRADLQQFFSLSAYPAKKTKSCFVVTGFNGKNPTDTIKGRSMDLDASSIRKYIHGYSIEQIFTFLDRYDKPFVVEGGISSIITDIDFPDHFVLSDQKTVVECLKTIGFDIKEAEKEVDVVVISGKNGEGKSE